MFQLQPMAFGQFQYRSPFASYPTRNFMWATLYKVMSSSFHGSTRKTGITPTHFTPFRISTIIINALT